MKKINIIFMTLVALTAQYGVASDDEVSLSLSKASHHTVPLLEEASKVVTNRVSRLSPYQIGITGMIKPYIAVSELVPLIVDYVGKSEYEVYRQGDTLWRALDIMLEEKPKMYINSFDINAHHANSSDPLLHDVVVNGNLNMLNKFLALTPNLNALNNAGRTALFVIPKTNLERVHSEMVKLLVKAGAVIDVRDENGRTAQEYWNMCPMFNMKGEPITTIDLTKIDTTPAGDMAPQAGPISIIVEDLLSELTTVSVQK